MATFLIFQKYNTSVTIHCFRNFYSRHDCIWPMAETVGRLGNSYYKHIKYRDSNYGIFFGTTRVRGPFTPQRLTSCCLIRTSGYGLIIYLLHQRLACLKVISWGITKNRHTSSIPCTDVANRTCHILHASDVTEGH